MPGVQCRCFKIQRPELRRKQTAVSWKEQPQLTRSSLFASVLLPRVYNCNCHKLLLLSSRFHPQLGSSPVPSTLDPFHFTPSSGTQSLSGQSLSLSFLRHECLRCCTRSALQLLTVRSPHLHPSTHPIPSIPLRYRLAPIYQRPTAKATFKTCSHVTLRSATASATIHVLTLRRLQFWQACSTTTTSADGRIVRRFHQPSNSAPTRWWTVWSLNNHFEPATAKRWTLWGFHQRAQSASTVRGTVWLFKYCCKSTTTEWRSTTGRRPIWWRRWALWFLNQQTWWTLRRIHPKSTTGRTTTRTSWRIVWIEYRARVVWIVHPTNATAATAKTPGSSTEIRTITAGTASVTVTMGRRPRLERLSIDPGADEHRQEQVGFHKHLFSTEDVHLPTRGQ